MANWEKGFVAGIYRCSKGDINSGNIRFAEAPFLYSKTVVGGSSKAHPAKEQLEVTFVPRGTSHQFLYGDKRLMNNRNPQTNDFFTAIGAVEGTLLKITRTGPRSITIEKF